MIAGTILVVEDNGIVRKLVEAVLKSGGFEVLTASSAKQAMLLEVSFSGDIHLLLSDVMMPDMCGPDLAIAMQERRPDMRVMLMSGYADGALLILNNGWHFIKKPFLPGALLERVKATLNSKLSHLASEHIDEGGQAHRDLFNR